ncbi:transcriptional regulator SWI6 PWA37_002790 [Arxiozyma heterogenica]|uniref:transcriptional regulator SWI6 n=1 Tax=Arxiozyma heterogenica TaxID=278026 RepID=UPI002EF110B1
MTFVDITGYLNDGTCIVLKRNTRNGYITLKPFLPILDQLNDYNNINPNLSKTESNPFTIDAIKLHKYYSNDVTNKDMTLIDTNKENLLLTKFGVLVDTDANGDKWITGEKAIQILKKANLYDIFKDKLTSDTNRTKTITNIHKNSSTEDNHNTTTTMTSSTTSKRNTDSFSQSTDPQRQLGSPLKKVKLDKSLKLDHSLSEGFSSFPLYKHDLHLNFVNVPLTIQKTIPTASAIDKDERLKLETFLQKLLFPSTGENNNYSTNEQSYNLVEKALLQELDAMFPHVLLNLNIPVDEHGNTPLHWLTSIANLNLVKSLVKLGSNRLLGDNDGESPLVKAVKSANNYDSGTFEELLDYLYPCLILEDNMNRTVLHHIVITSGVAGCSSVAKYYLDVLMGWIVKKEDRISNLHDVDPILKNLTLNWVLVNMLNLQDSNGDTCLNIAARLGNVGIVDALLEYGADPYIANKSGLRPVDFGVRALKDSNITENNNNSNHTNSIHATPIAASGNYTEDKGLTPPANDTSKNSKDDVDNNVNHVKNNSTTNFKLDSMKEPDTMSLINDLKVLLSDVTKDYEDELSEHKKKLSKLHEELNSQRKQLALTRERLQNAKQLNDEYILLKEQLINLQKGIKKEETNFIEESKRLGISTEETAGIDWDSGDFDVDEPFRINLIHDFLETKLTNEYHGDIEKLLNEESVENVMKQIRSKYDVNKIKDELPSSTLLKTRINAYKKNDEYLQTILNDIHENQSDLEGKFRRVLALCLKVDESKVDSMLDGLLQAISSKDPQDMDTNEMQEFLNKHAIV